MNCDPAATNGAAVPAKDGPETTSIDHQCSGRHPVLQADETGLLDARGAFLGEVLIEAFARGCEHERQRMHDLARSSKTTRALYCALMADAIGGER